MVSPCSSDIQTQHLLVALGGSGELFYKIKRSSFCFIKISINCSFPKTFYVVKLFILVFFSVAFPYFLS